jgi:hypothetical protein
MKSAPASISGGAFAGVMPPIATLGIPDKVAHQARIDASGRYSRRVRVRRVESAERDVIRPGFPRFHREMAAVVARPPDLRLRSQQRARRDRVAVTLPQMHAVAPQPRRQVHAVVEQKRDVMLRAQRHQRLGGRDYVLVRHALQPQLKRRHRPAGERLLQTGCELRPDILRRHEIKLTRRPPLPLKGRRELWVERIHVNS